jgi:hypothetical protein
MANRKQKYSAPEYLEDMGGIGYKTATIHTAHRLHVENRGSTTTGKYFEKGIAYIFGESSKSQQERQYVESHFQKYYSDNKKKLISGNAVELELADGGYIYLWDTHTGVVSIKSNSIRIAQRDQDGDNIDEKIVEKVGKEFIRSFKKEKVKAILATLAYDQENDKWYVLVSDGGHTFVIQLQLYYVLRKYGMDNPDMDVVVPINIRPEKITYDENGKIDIDELKKNHTYSPEELKKINDDAYYDYNTSMEQSGYEKHQQKRTHNQGTVKRMEYDEVLKIELSTLNGVKTVSDGETDKTGHISPNDLGTMPRLVMNERYHKDNIVPKTFDMLHDLCKNDKFFEHVQKGHMPVIEKNMAESLLETMIILNRVLLPSQKKLKDIKSYRKFVDTETVWYSDAVYNLFFDTCLTMTDTVGVLLDANNNTDTKGYLNYKRFTAKLDAKSKSCYVPCFENTFDNTTLRDYFEKVRSKEPKIYANMVVYAMFKQCPEFFDKDAMTNVSGYLFPKEVGVEFNLGNSEVIRKWFGYTGSRNGFDKFLLENGRKYVEQDDNKIVELYHPEDGEVMTAKKGTRAYNAALEGGFVERKAAA